MNDYLEKLKIDLTAICQLLIDKNILNNDFNYTNLSIDYFSKSKMGEVSSNIFIILRANLKDKKFDLTGYLNSSLSKINYISKIDISKHGFVNIFFKKNYIVSLLKKIILNSNTYGNNKHGLNKRINIEFVSANPTGPIHVAHMRGAILGDVLSSILISTGFDVTREYYVNDAGSQILHLGNSVFKRYQQLFSISVEFKKDEYPGEYITHIAKKIANKDSDKWLIETNNKTNKYFQEFAIKEIIQSISEDLKSINVNFDNFIYESQIVKNNTIERVFNILKNKNLLYEGHLEKPKGDSSLNWKPRKQLLFRSSKFDDDNDRPFKKENGEWTYFANDAAYHYDKYLRKYSNLINIWGADHIGYISRMKSIVEVITNKKNYLDIYVCQIVRLIKNNKLLKMSKREDNFITLKEILEQVGKDSLRYFMISSKSETPMDFDLNRVIEKNKDNPVFYCQYAYARASSVINKSKLYNDFSNFEKMYDEFDYTLLSSYEWDIILKLISWPYLLNQSSMLRQPHKITNYLEEICGNFHSFWNRGKEDNNLRIINIDEKNKTITKLIWIESFRIVLKRAFTIIGIKAPENM